MPLCHYTCPVTTQSAHGIARGSKNNPVFRTLARVGYAVNGLIHLLIGLITIGIATGTATADADESGALGQLASSPAATVILWVVVIGLAALGLWLLVSAFVTTDADPKRKWGHRVAELGKAIAYFVVAGSALTLALGGSTGSGGSASSASAALIAAPGGVVLLAAVGFGVLAIGAYFVYKGVTRKFTEDIDVPHGRIGQATIALGTIGYVAKGIAIGIVGILLTVAAFTLDPSRAEGLDGALKSLLELPFGAVILYVIGAGLIAYGVYCFARARRARL